MNFDVKQVFASSIIVEIQLIIFYMVYVKSWFMLNERKWSLFWKFRYSIQKHILEVPEEILKLFNFIKVLNDKILL